MKMALVGVLAALLLFGCTANGQPSEKQKVNVDFMYYGNCSYCHQMEPELAAAVAEFGGQVEVRKLDAELRGHNQTVTGKYLEYKANGKFGGFPTLVADGNDALVGLRSKDEIRQWLCGQFAQKPQACG